MGNLVSHGSCVARQFVVLIACLLAAVILSAQNPNGALRGEVQDSSGARVAGAHIAVQSFGSSLTREATSDERGEFRIEGFCRAAITWW